jgi:DnaJ family protein A protein 2
MRRQHACGRGGASAAAPAESLYDVLGVPTTASQSDVKKAYMKLARESHPDRGGDVEVFKKVQHAYEVLSDADKRERYDRTGDDGTGGGGGDGGADPHDFLAAMFGGQMRQQQQRGPRKGEPTMHPLKVSLEDCFSGKTVKIAVTKTVLEEDAGGAMMDRQGKRYRQRSEREVLDVVLERGARHGQRLVFENKGDVRPGFLPGDVVLVVQVKDHAVFQRRGADLIMKKEVRARRSRKARAMRAKPGRH